MHMYVTCVPGARRSLTALLHRDVTSAEAHRLGASLADLRALQRDADRRQLDPRLPQERRLRAARRPHHGREPDGLLS